MKETMRDGAEKMGMERTANGCGYHTVGNLAGKQFIGFVLRVAIFWVWPFGLRVLKAPSIQQPDPT